MNQGMSLNELAAEITRQQAAKKDYLAPAEKTKVRLAVPATWTPNPEHTEEEILQERAERRELELDLDGHSYPLTDHAHGQVAQRLSIPKRYYDRMRAEAPELLAHSVDTWLHHNPQRTMVRTLDGRARAILSDRYRPLDNDLILEAALPVLYEKAQRLEIKSLQLSERRLYVQVMDHQVQGEVRPGEVVAAGFTLSNSEVGAGAVNVEEMVWTLACINGQIVTTTLRRHHVGARADTGDQVVADYYAEETQEATARAFLLQLRDTLKHVLSEDNFSQRLNQLKLAAGREFTKPLSEVVEVTGKIVDLNQGESDSVLQHLASGGDFTQWGVASALTRHAQDVEPDRAYQLEKAGQKVVELTPDQWGTYYLAEAA